MGERSRSGSRARARIRAGLVAAAASAAATGVALVVHPDRAFGAVPLYLLSVVVAAAIGGAGSGLATSVLSFLSLNYFFTQPRHTLRVTHAEDVVALVVFLVVAVIVGSLLSRALAERARAVRSERDARLLGFFATKVMSGVALDAVLDDLAGALVDSLRLASCRILARADARAFETVRTRDGADAGTSTTVSIRIGDEDVGTLAATWAAGAEAGSDDDRRLLEAAARQVAVAIERAMLDEQIASARMEAETSQVRAALFSSVTHDLRTPLASIKGGVTSLLQEDVTLDDSQRRELLWTVLEETDRLNRLLGNLLDLARVRAGALVPAKEPTAIDEVIESVLHRMEPRLGGVRIRTILRQVPEIPVDPVQLDQVVTNLLENAARFSPPGGEVLVTVSPWHGFVQVGVADQGPGIPVADRERVFEAFYRGDSGERSGTGLGLAIARAIVLAHGGRIRIDGAPTGGTAVVFELPVADAAPVPQETARQ